MSSSNKTNYLGNWTAESQREAKNYASKFAQTRASMILEDVKRKGESSLEKVLTQNLYDEMYWAYYFGALHAFTKCLRDLPK